MDDFEKECYDFIMLPEEEQDKETFFRLYDELVRRCIFDEISENINGRRNFTFALSET